MFAKGWELSSSPPKITKVKAYRRIAELVGQTGFSPLPANNMAKQEAKRKPATAGF
jgi:hypothetical protein